MTLRWHVACINNKIQENWYRRSSNIKVLPLQFVGINDGRDL
jgi:hypothetical protein